MPVPQTWRRRSPSTVYDSYIRHIYEIAGLDVRSLADLATKTEQELATHAGNARSPRVAVDRGHDREPLGAFTDGCNLSIVEDDGGSRTTSLQMGREPKLSHGAILAPT